MQVKAKSFISLNGRNDTEISFGAIKPFTAIIHHNDPSITCNSTLYFTLYSQRIKRKYADTV